MAGTLVAVYSGLMATVKKGMLTASGEWWKHLRMTKRTFWKGERRAAKHEATSEVPEARLDYDSLADEVLRRFPKILGRLGE